jgi:hypothetical protein
VLCVQENAHINQRCIFSRVGVDLEFFFGNPIHATSTPCCVNGSAICCTLFGPECVDFFLERAGDLRVIILREKSLFYKP